MESEHWLSLAEHRGVRPSPILPYGMRRRAQVAMETVMARMCKTCPKFVWDEICQRGCALFYSLTVPVHQIELYAGVCALLALKFECDSERRIKRGVLAVCEMCSVTRDGVLDVEREVAVKTGYTMPASAIEFVRSVVPGFDCRRGRNAGLRRWMTRMVVNGVAPKDAALGCVSVLRPSDIINGGSNVTVVPPRNVTDTRDP